MAPNDTTASNRGTEAKTTDRDGETIPTPPAYDPHYSDDRRERLEGQGSYGVMYAGDYEWSDIRCTAEAYGDADRSADRSGIRTGRPRRSLAFHSTWLTPETARVAIQHIGTYNRFKPDAVGPALGRIEAPLRVVVGRESSPVLYLWAADPREAMTELANVDPEDAGDDPRSVFAAGGPDELGWIPDADGYPVPTVGKSAETAPSDKWAMIRCWWD